MGGAGGGSNFVGVNSNGLLLSNRMWGLPLVRRVERCCVLIWEAFLCVTVLLWMTLSAFVDGDTS